MEIGKEKGNRIMTNQINAKTSGSELKTEFKKSSSRTIFFNTCFDKNHLKTLIAWFLEQYGEKVTVDLVETLKQVGFHQATRAGVSLGVDDLKIPPQKTTLLSQASLKMNQVKNSIQTGNLTSVEKSQRLIDTWNQTSETLRQTAVQNFRATNPVNPVYMMAFSGARGNISQVRQLVAMRGLMADPQGAILEFPIQSNFREGLTITEYLISCYGARKGLVDTALRTATSGYLTRRLVDAVQHVVIHVTDCQTKKGIIIKDKNIEQRLIGRVLFQDIILNTTTVKKNTLISPNLAKQIASSYKEIVVRSPLTCKTEKSVCQLCYGVDLSQGKLVSIGEAVGIIAAQSIGEPGTQLTMRTFHTGGVGVFSDQAMKSLTAPFEGKVEFLEPLSGLFVRTPHGNIVYLLKHKTVLEKKPILRLTSFQSMYKANVYEIMHSDVPSGSLLWVKQGECVKAGQLLVQASRLQTTTQEMPESSHPVRAPLSGEVFFQSMTIRVIEEKRLIPKQKKKKQLHLPNNSIFGITTSQLNQKEISPKFPTLIELGNFWIFSTFIQKEDRICKSFFIEGDLLSSETPIQQYNLHLLRTGQLKKLNSLIVFGTKSFEFLFSNIHYYKFFYFLQKPSQQRKGSFKNQKTDSNVLVYSSNSKSTLLTWYPFFKNPGFHSLGYCLKVDFENNFVGTKNSEFLETSKGGIQQKQNLNKFQKLSYLWSPHKLLRFKATQNKLALFENKVNFEQNKCFNFSDFVVAQTDKSFSKIGFFQVESTKTVEWQLKTEFHLDFVKNLHKNSQKKRVLEINKSSNSKLFHNSLSFFQKNLFENFYAKGIQKTQVWPFIPKIAVLESLSSQLSPIVIEPGKKFETVCFDKTSSSSILLNTKNILFLKSKTNEAFCFYSLLEILNTEKDFQTSFSKTPNGAGQPIEKQLSFSLDNRLKKFVQIKHFNRQCGKTFCFYKQHGFFLTKNFVFELKKHRRLSHILIFQKNCHQIFSTERFFKQNIVFQKTGPLSISIKSPFFTKQCKTTRSVKEIFSKEMKDNHKVSFKIISPTQSRWFSLSSLVKIEMTFATSNYFGKTEQLKQTSFLPIKPISKKEVSHDFSKKEMSGLNNFQGHHLSANRPLNSMTKTTIPVGFEKNSLDFVPVKHSQTLIYPSFNIFFYQGIKLKNSDQFDFLSFPDGWILPESKITKAFLTSKKLGEFTSAQEKQKQSAFSLVQTQHRSTVKLDHTQNTNILDTARVDVGKQVRWGQEFFKGFAIPISGQIIKTTTQTLTLRKGIPLLASIRGLVHISHNDLVEKNDLLITLRSRRLQTEDIVQGIPKIEQLFEARETQGGEIIQNNMHTLLNNFFMRARQIKPFDEAVQLSLTYIQKFLVENILEAYLNQGVTIAEKHVEVIVRQMTARVRITHGGDTGFLPGEFVQLSWIEKVNQSLGKLGRRPAQYEPVILGITKSVLQSESFLVAASFQQVSKVLVRSALAKKTDFLRGLHENILVGQPIPAGTGIIELTKSIEKIQDSIDMLD